jgi:hypothetical protein
VEVDYKALTTMRLDPKGGYRYARVSNPLHESSLQADDRSFFAARECFLTLCPCRATRASRSVVRPAPPPYEA